MLTIKNLHASVDGKEILRGIDLTVNPGEIHAIMGPNGAGKTTSFYIIVGLIKSDSGFVYIGDNNITKLPMYKRARKGIGYLAQEASVFRNLSVEDNILAVLENQGISKEDQLERTEKLLNEFGLVNIRNYMGKILSGGERRRTEIARALATEPNFILLDEPFAGVDPIAVEEIQSIIYKLKQKNIGILITDHNVGETLFITDRSYLMFEGRLLTSGTSEELASDDQVRKLYLGKHFKLKSKL